VTSDGFNQRDDSEAPRRPAAGAGGDMSFTSYDPACPVSIIVVNWNGRTHLDVCLSSALAQTIQAVEVIVVDNGSNDDSVPFVRERFGTSVRIVAHGANLGYGAGVNAGIRVARGRYLFALNNDTELHPDCLRHLVEAADTYLNAGSCAPKILSFHDRGLIDNVGHLLYPDGLSRGRGRLEVDRGQYDRPEEVIGPSGCAVLLRRAMLADVGLFDEDFFAYCDDTDLGLRARLAGWTCRYVPEAVVYHKYSASSSEYSPLKAFLVERNRVWAAVKCLPGWLLALSPLFTLLRFGAQAWGVLRRRGAAGRFAARHSSVTLAVILARAGLAAAARLPRMWQRRRVIQRHRRVPAAAAIGWLRNFGMGVREVALRD
jgi:GT2 family glycosyltransferase